MDEIEEVQQHNMISNLPLLFANGYPTSLEKITEAQLENFIPFMVQCSLGHINLQAKFDFNEPEWWPENVPFTIPFSKPRKFVGNWKEKMKDIVNICYQFHRSIFLLRFCRDLASFEHASLRFINNYNSTTSLFDRRSNKLLVTFRNENMSYDQPQRSRKCLLQQKAKRNGQMEQQIMVEPAPFDIYLCEYCDAELYSEEALMEHEKTCNLVNDVIICDSPEPPEEIQIDLSPKTTENNELRIGFLINFNLQSRENNSINCRSTLNYSTPATKDSSLPNNQEKTKEALFKEAQEKLNAPVEKLKRLPRRNRAVHSLSRCPTIPLSSPAGQLLIRTSKTLMTQDYLRERLERTERFCHTPLITKASAKPKYFHRKYTTNTANCSFKKPQDYTNDRNYVFPRRQFSQKHRMEQFKFVNSLLFKKCRPMSVRLKKIPESEIRLKRSPQNSKLNIKLTRDTSRSSNWKISSTPSTEIIVDTIDLCSSDDELVNDSHVVETIALNKPTNQLPAVNCRFSNKSLISKISKRLSSEVTLTPIRKAFANCAIKKEKKVNIPNIHMIASGATQSATTTPGSIFGVRVNEKKNTTRYEGNIMLSPTNGSSSPPKPLQPSVFFFSNYTNPIAIVASNNNEIITPFISNSLDSISFQSQNQENQLEINNSKRNSNSTMSIATSDETTTVDWFPTNAIPTAINSNISSSNNLINSSISNMISTSNNTINNNSATSRSVERSSRSLPLLQCKRVISIDLTS